MRYLSNVLRALTAAKAGPTIYDLCDAELLGLGSGDQHMRLFYRRALANPALRPLLSRAGLPALREEGVFTALRDVIRVARDEPSPDWSAVGRPLADLLDRMPPLHPRRGPAPAVG